MKKFSNKLAGLREEMVPKLMPIVLFGTREWSIMSSQSSRMVNLSRNTKQMLANTEHSLRIRETAYLTPKQLDYDISAIFFGNLDNEWYGKIEKIDAMYNPMIKDIDGKFLYDYEYFINAPFMRAIVGRYEHVEVSYLDEGFEERTRAFSGRNARVIQ